MAVTADKPAPYAPTSAIIELIERHRSRGLPTPINSDMLARVGISDSLIPRTLQALYALDLVGVDDGMPTKTFEAIRLAPEAEYKKRLVEWLKSAYADIFSVVDPSKDDVVRIRDAFRGYQPVGQQGRMVSLFQGLCSAAGLLPEKTPTPRPAARAKPAASARSSTMQRAASHLTYKTVSKKSPQGLPPAITGLLESLPSVGDEWSAADRERFLSTFEAVLDFCYPIAKEEKKKTAATD